MTIFNYFKQKEKKKNAKSYIDRARRLKRVKEGNKTRIIGASEQEIQEIKTGLDTNMIMGRYEKQSEKELRRLGFLA